MSKLSPAQTYASLLAGGFSSAQAQTMTEIAAAESGLDPSAIGDTALENSTWGPSVGLFQIRTLKAQTGTGSVRDIQWLQGSVPNQVKAALSISGGGKNFTPWSTYTSGSYQKYAQDASFLDKLKGLPGDLLGKAGGAAGDAASGALGSLTAPLLEGFKSTAYTLTFGALGLGLVGFGIYKAFSPQIKGVAGAAAKVAAL